MAWEGDGRFEAELVSGRGGSTGHAPYQNRVEVHLPCLALAQSCTHKKVRKRGEREMVRKRERKRKRDRKRTRRKEREGKTGVGAWPCVGCEYSGLGGGWHGAAARPRQDRLVNTDRQRHRGRCRHGGRQADSMGPRRFSLAHSRLDQPIPPNRNTGVKSKRHMAAKEGANGGTGSATQASGCPTRRDVVAPELGAIFEAVARDGLPRGVGRVRVDEGGAQHTATVAAAAVAIAKHGCTRVTVREHSMRVGVGGGGSRRGDGVRSAHG